MKVEVIQKKIQKRKELLNFEGYIIIKWHEKFNIMSTSMKGVSALLFEV